MTDELRALNNICTLKQSVYRIDILLQFEISPKVLPKLHKRFRSAKQNGSQILNRKLERAADGAPSQIPTLKFFTPPAPPSSTPGHDPSNRMKILFNLFSIFYLWEHTHKVWYKNLWNWHVNDIWPFDLSPRSPVWP